MPERAEQLHDEHRRKMWDDTKSGTENFDRYMLTFSAGALGLSLAFVKDVVPLGKAVWVSCLFYSWIAFVLCILVTLISFRISIRALEKLRPLLDDFYLKGNAEAFNKHMESLSYKAIDWCANSAIILFVLGLILTMMFVGANIQEAKRMNKQEAINKVVVPDAGKALKPAAMTPIIVNQQTNDGLKPSAMTPVTSAGENRGLKPSGMTPVSPQAPAQSAPATPAQPAQSPKK